MKSDLAGIGIQLDLQPPGQSSNNPLYDFNLHTPLGIAEYGSDFLSASNFIEPLLSPGLGFNTSLIGESPADLRDLHYRIRHVPSLDSAIATCVGTTGEAAIPFWTGIDTTAMEHVLPIVPLFFKTYVRTFSPRVTAFSWDQWTGLPALDRIALKPGASSAGGVPQAAPSPSCGPSPIPAGTYVTRIRKHDRPPASVGGSQAVGTYTLLFGGADLAACLHSSRVIVLSGGFEGFKNVQPYTIKGSEILFGDSTGVCPGFGIYRWKVLGDSLTFREVDDKQCPIREFLNAAHPWIRRG